MKKLFKILTTVFALALAVACFAACDNGLTKGGSAKGASDIDISDPDFGFVKEEDYDPDTFNIETAHKWTVLDVDSDYYLILTFDVTAVQNNNGQSLLNVDITFDTLEVMDGTIQAASTGGMVEMTFQDAGTGKVGKTITLSFKIPSTSTQPKTINLIVGLKPMQVGESHISIAFRYDPSEEVASADSYKANGSDGKTQNLKIQAVKIDTPVLSVDAMGTLIWNHVKNADYYQIYEGSSTEPVKDYLGEVIRVSAEGMSVGAEMRKNMGEFATGYKEYRVRAFSNNKNIEQSNFSNVVSHEWLG